MECGGHGDLLRKKPLCRRGFPGPQGGDVWYPAPAFLDEISPSLFWGLQAGVERLTSGGGKHLTIKPVHSHSLYEDNGEHRRARGVLL